MKKPAFWLVSLGAILAIGGTTLSADRLRLRSGQVVTGDLMSADVKMVKLLLANGSVAQYPVADISALGASSGIWKPAIRIWPWTTAT